MLERRGDEPMTKQKEYRGPDWLFAGMQLIIPVLDE